jgi:hypothetical protein
MKVAQIWSLWALTHVAVATAECLQFIGLYAESQVPLVLATACLDKVDELCEGEQHFD